MGLKTAKKHNLWSRKYENSTKYTPWSWPVGALLFPAAALQLGRVHCEQHSGAEWDHPAAQTRSNKSYQRRCREKTNHLPRLNISKTPNCFDLRNQQPSDHGTTCLATAAPQSVNLLFLFFPHLCSKIKRFIQWFINGYYYSSLQLKNDRNMK